MIGILTDTRAYCGPVIESLISPLKRKDIYITIQYWTQVFTRYHLQLYYWHVHSDNISWRRKNPTDYYFLATQFHSERMLTFPTVSALLSELI